MSNQKSKIFYAVLDWGLGHASRSAPIIDELLHRGYSVSIGGAGRSLQLLKSSFPGLEFVELPAYNPEMDYASISIRRAWQLSRSVWKQRKTEKRLLDDWLKKNSCVAILSDNRYGCYHSCIPSVIISHQTQVLLPPRYRRFERIVNPMIHSFLKDFDELWIPDEEGSVMSGALSSWHHPKTYFTGPLSSLQVEPRTEKKYDLVCVLSGTEPQRTAFEEKLIEQLKDSDRQVLLIEGIPGSLSTRRMGSLRIVSSMQRTDLSEALSQSKAVLGRSGYSSVMDYLLNGLKAILVPTEGQSEQEYVAQNLQNHPQFLIRDEKSLNLPADLAILLQRAEINGPSEKGMRKMKALVDRFLAALPKAH